MATIAATAKHWNVSKATVTRLTREYGEAAKAERQRFELERLDAELEAHQYGLRMMFLGQRNRHLSQVEVSWFNAEAAARGTSNEPAVIAAKEAALENAEREFREGWERCMGPLPDLFGTR